MSILQKNNAETVSLGKREFRYTAAKNAGLNEYWKVSASCRLMVVLYSCADIYSSWSGWFIRIINAVKGS